MDFLKRACQWIAKVRNEKGFYTPAKLTGPLPEGVVVTDGDIMLGKLMLVVSEISEAAESARDGDLPHFSEEIADAYIRLNDIVETMGIDIEAEITRKMEKNEKRPAKHGRLTNL